MNNDLDNEMRGRLNLDNEMLTHLEEKIADLMERGFSEPDARAQALREFGNRTLYLEDSRNVWRWAWLDRLRQDLCHALRGMRRSPGFTATVIATLALGIGANTAIFSAVNAVLIRPLPYPAPDRLMWLTTYVPYFKSEAVNGPDYFDWREQAHSFDAMMAEDYAGNKTLADGDDAGPVFTAQISGDFAAITGARPMLGRLFAPGELNALVLTNSFFEQRYRGDASVIGRRVTLDGQPATIVGVLPAGFWFYEQVPKREADAFQASPISPANQLRGKAGLSIVSVIARLKPGVSIETAKTEIDGIESRIVSQWKWTGAAYQGLTVRVEPLQSKLVGNSRPALLVLMAAVGLVLLIACANVANLLLARSSARQREITIRTALGAGRWRLARQLLTESLLLALAGGAAGLLLARSGVQLLARFGPADVPRLHQVSLDAKVVAFALALSLLTGLLFGSAPVFALSKSRLNEVFKESGRNASAGRAARFLRALLAAAEIAIALALLAGAGLMVKSFWRMNQRSPGFDPEETLVMKISLSGPAYAAPPRQIAYYDEALRRLAAVPGVQAAGLGNGLLRGSVTVDGVPRDPAAPQPISSIHAASEGYLRAIGLHLREGRWLTDHETDPVVVVNETFALLVARGDPLGRHAFRGTIVGVVADLKYSKLDADPAPEIYVPYRFAPYIGAVDLVVRCGVDPEVAALELRKTVADIDKTQPVYGVQTLEQSLADSIAPRRFNMLLLAIFAGVAMLLATLGIYGVLSYVVSQRTQEIGVRIALGARQSEVVGMVIKQGMLVAIAGVAAGLAGALWLTHLMSSLLYGVQPWDAPVFLTVCASLILAALAACWIPARRAARVDPVIALRYE
jgi:putative ABC transport system permease protein